MPLYRIFRMKDHERLRFRNQPHTSGATLVKPRDFEERGTVDALSCYDAWTQLRPSNSPIDIGDLLIAPNDEMRILKYIGFEEARWVLPDPKPMPDGIAPPEHAQPVEAEPAQ